MPQRPLSNAALADTTSFVDSAQDATTAVGGGGLIGPDEAHPPIVGRYVLLRPLGAGGMGVVYLAYDPALDRKVAVKLLRTGRQRAINAVPRLLREAKALARLTHPNIVELFDVGEVDGQVFLAMEYVEGDTLRRWSSKAVRSLRQTLHAYVQAGRGLAAAHAEGLVHRDFKPENVLVDRKGRVRVLDFGLAVQRGESAEAPLDGTTPPELGGRLTRTGTALGTPAFMSPEQLRGELPDARSDQFSFCVSLWAALFGVRPFVGNTPRELQASITRGPKPPTDTSRVPLAIRRALVRGLQCDANQRWPSMNALLRRLDASARRHKHIALALGVSAVGLGATGVSVHAHATEAKCGDATLSRWNDASEAEMRDAFAASELSFAAPTWQRVKVALTGYATSWSEHRRATCRDTALDDATFDLRIECLNDRRERFNALVDVLRDPDADIIRNASRAVSNLPALARCVDDDALRSTNLPPPPPEVAQEVASIRAALVEAEALQLAGRYTASFEMALALEGRADATGNAAIRALAQLRLGELDERMGRYADAEARHVDAAMLATEAGDSAVAARAMLSLTGITGYLLARPDDGQRWARHAAAMITRAQLGERQQARLLNASAAIHFRAGEFTEAVALYRQATTLVAEPANDGERAELATAHNNMGNCLAQLERREEAAEHLGIALRLLTELRGKAHPDTAITMGNLGSLYLDTGRFESAVELQGRSLAIRRATLPEEHPFVAASMMNLALAHGGLGDYQEAHRLLARAVELKQAVVGTEHPDLARALNNLGEVQRELGDIEGAIASHERAREIWIATQGDDYPHLGYPETNLGQDYLAAGDTERAGESLRRAFEICRSRPEHRTLLAVVRQGLARLDVMKGEVGPSTRRHAQLAVEGLRNTRYRAAYERAVATLADLPDTP